jgi:hypothetical protein
VVLSAEGEFISLHEDPVDFCKTIKQVLQASSTIERLKAFWSRNAVSLDMLRTNLPDLKSEAGEHYADILAARYRKQLKALQEDAKADAPQASSDKDTKQIDKTCLAIGAPPRIRDKAHLRFVGSRPCLVCGRSPSHAHHLRHAQPRALGRKVSDEWVVPLCALHHRALHGVGREETWWQDQKLDPLIEARRLWRESRPPNMAVPG